MQNFDTAFVAVTSEGNWGKSTELYQALKNANVEFSSKKIKIFLVIFMFKEGTPESVRDDILKMFHVSDLGGVHLNDGLSEADMQLLKSYLCGYAYSHINREK